jgi:exodeoxyribonuclease VII small subunit
MVQVKSKLDVEGMSFEEAMEELERVVVELERGDVALEDSIRAYEYGSLLKSWAESKLSSAKERIERLDVEGGKLEAVPLEGMAGKHDG